MTKWSAIAFRSRLSIFVVALLTVQLCGCNEKWSIQSVVVNPQPLSGTDPVNPVVLYAPMTAGTASQQFVNIDVVIARDSGFTDSLKVVVNTAFAPLNGHGFTTATWFHTGSSTRAGGVFLTVTCTRVASGTVQLNVVAKPNTEADDGVTFSGTTMASTSVNIGVATDLTNSNDYPITWAAPHQLAISCLRDNPIN
jgi:hypothetical protein